ncbi:MAG TPA: hypothetical protein VFP12_17510 [Allosphingosinicella sp.]|nr:hypothetical protein [Allosphingosinicella sp.]
MSRDNRGIAIAAAAAVAGTAAIAALSWPDPPTLKRYAYEEARPGSVEGRGANCLPSRLAAIQDLVEAERQRIACAKEAEEHRLQTNDLIQQTRAADAAAAQAEIAKQVAWMTFLQTIGGFLTLTAAAAAAFYAREAAREGRRAADAAEKTLAHSAETARVELRPYLAVENESVYQEDEESIPRRIWIRVGYNNTGATPALSGMLHSEAWVEPGVDLPRHTLDLTVATLLPRSTQHANLGLNLIDEELEALQQEGARLKFDYELTFTDVFGEKWRHRQTFYASWEDVLAKNLFTEGAEQVVAE